LRFLIDNALSPVVARLLRLAGHDAVHLRERNLHAATDAVVFELAAAEGRALVSADTDFAQILAHRGASRPSLILFRSSRARRPEAQADLLLTRLAEIAERIEAGSIVVFDEARVRVRPLPIQPDDA
jgi:predicted nuclease of predicted toxin-antitoxin system